MSRLRASRVAIPPLLTLAAVVAAWEAVTALALVPAFLVPRPSAIASYIINNAAILWPHTQATMSVTLLGFAAALIFGIVIAIVIVWFPKVESAVYPLLVMTQVIPKVAIAPLIVVYLGFGLEPKVVLAFLVAFFPVVINTVLGLRSVDPELLELLASLRASKWQILRMVRWYRAIPLVVESAKIAGTLSIIGAIVGEFAAGNVGLGYLINAAASSVNTVLSYASLVVLIVAGIILFELIHVGGLLATPWVRRETEREHLAGTP